MKNRSPFLVALLGLALTSAALSAADILANGDFSNGKAHWKGDGKDASSANITDISASLGNQSAAHGMMLQLKEGWTSVSQIFNTRETNLEFQMTYKTSADFALTPAGVGAPGDLQTILETLVGFRLRSGGRMTIPPNAALVVISDPSQNLVIYNWVPLAPTSTGEQTVAAKIPGLMAHEEKTFFLAFPPGKGTITFLKLALNKPGEGGPAPASPFH